MKRSRAIGWIAASLLAAAPAFALIDPGSSTVGWTIIAYPNLQPDYSNDQQTGIPEADIVGNTANPAFYLLFDDNGTASLADDQIAFRIRLGADKNPVGFDKFFGVGLDADLNGSLDLFIGVDNTGSNNQIALFDPGSGANTSPSTTSLVTTPLVSYTETSSNFRFAPVTLALDPTATSFDLDADGDTDHFLTFVVPFADLASEIGIPGFGPDSPVSFVAGSSTQPNALNQDLNGPNGATTSALLWDQLGAISSPFPFRPAPEPNTAVLLMLGLGMLAGARRRSAKR